MLFDRTEKQTPSPSLSSPALEARRVQGCGRGTAGSSSALWAARHRRGRPSPGGVLRGFKAKRPFPSKLLCCLGLWSKQLQVETSVTPQLPVG